jgi:hypothetical protein
VDEAIKGVGLGYGRQLYVRCLLKYMVICAFENHPSIPSFLETQIVYIGYGQSYLSIAVLPVYLYLIAANNSVLLLYACVYKISLAQLWKDTTVQIQCKQSVFPRSLELRGDFQTHR